jgi:hypothetical protein
MSFEYNGKPKFSRNRILSEVESPNESTKIPPIIDPRSAEVDQAFTNVAKSYLKGRIVKDALSKMDPAQWIPIEEPGLESAAAIRISEEDSKNGTIITYSMFQSCVDFIIDTRKDISGQILSGDIPATVKKQIETYTSSNSGGLKVFNPLIEWVKDNGVACSLLAAITISPWVTEFYALSAEEASSKTVHISKVVLAISILLEIGAKYDSIIAIFKNAALSVPNLDTEVNRLAKSRKSRRDVLSEFNIDLDEFTRFNKRNDSQLIIDYVNRYYARYGGLQLKDGYLTIDHWLGYLQVVQANQLLKTTLNNAPHFSSKYRNILDSSGTIQDADTKFSGGTSRPLGITISIINSTARYTNDLYDDIVNALSYYLDDKALCCLVQIFGKAKGQDTLYSMAVLLRLLAMDFGITMSVVFDKFTRTLVDKMQDVLMDLLTKLNVFYDKVAIKITDAFTINIDNYTACSGMISLGWALLHAVRTLFEKIKSLIKRISAILGEFSNGFGSRADWATVADRRFLFGCSRILELLSNKIILANNCADSSLGRSSASEGVDYIELDNPAILSILDKAEPVIPISAEDRKKYFENTPPTISSRLKHIYGINPQQNNEDATSTSSCEDQRDKSVDIDLMVKNLTNSINAVFNE